MERQGPRSKGSPLCPLATQAQGSSRVLLPEGTAGRPEEGSDDNDDINNYCY